MAEYILARVKFDMNNILIIDGHNDTLTDIYSPKPGAARSFFEQSEHGHLDLPRAYKGGFAGGFFAIFIPPPESSPEHDPFFGLTLTNDGYESANRSPLDYAYANNCTNPVLDFADNLEKQSEGKVKIVRDIRELEYCLANNILAMILHIEGAEAIKEDLSDLTKFYQRGIRSLGLVWSRPNAFGHGVPYRHPHSPDTGPGLTKAGKNLVAACNEFGIIIDLAHINEKGFFDVAKISNRPLVVSHTAVHNLCPSTRNITDEQIDTVGKSDGIIGVWFEPVQIKFQKSNDGNPLEDVPLIEIAKHIDYIAKRIGVDHVGLGSDFDGAQMPKELPDASFLPRLLNALKNIGYGDNAIEKIAHKNWLRVIKKSWCSV